jgi:hypothetical protein
MFLELDAMTPDKHAVLDPPTYAVHTMEAVDSGSMPQKPQVLLTQSGRQYVMMAGDDYSHHGRLCHELDMTLARLITLCVVLVVKVSDLSADDAYDAIATSGHAIPATALEAVRDFLGPMATITFESLHRSINEAARLGATLESLRCYVGLQRLWVRVYLCVQTPSSYVWRNLQLPKHERQLGFCEYIVRRLKGAVMFPSLKKKIHKMRTNFDAVEALLYNLDMPLLVWRAPYLR